MDRKEFLKSIGAGAAFALTFSCLGGCTNDNGDVFSEDTSSETEIGTETGSGSETGTGTETNALLTIDLTATSSSALNNNGGYLVKNNIVVAKDLSGNYIAATNLCSHEQKRKVIFKNGEYYCTDHGARFDVSGNGLNNDGRGGLTTYITSLEGDILTITA